MIVKLSIILVMYIKEIFVPDAMKMIGSGYETQSWDPDPVFYSSRVRIST